MGFKPQNLLWGDSMPNRPLTQSSWLIPSHSAGATILVRSPSNCSCASRRSTVHWFVVYWICSTLSTECSLSGENRYLKACIIFIYVSFHSMSIVMRKASSIQCWMCALMTASFYHATSTCSFNAFACCSFASRWVKRTIYTILCTLSYCTWSSYASISGCYMLGSSYNEVRTVKDSSNIVV